MTGDRGRRSVDAVPGKGASADRGATQLAPGKRTLTEQLATATGAPAGVEHAGASAVGAVQRKADASTPATHDHDAPGIPQIADRGMAGPAGALPHLETIQRSFGPDHDLSGVRGFVGGPARAASAEMGALAYAQGNQVAFAETPSLHTAAHEAAHVIQQRAGVQLQGGVGAEGDAYERHADAVADAVVGGRSSAALLGAGPHASAASSAVQRKVNPTPTARRDRTALLGDGTPGKPGITLGEFQGYISQQADWFTEPTLDAAARFLLWELANMLQEGPQIGAALTSLRLSELTAMLAGDRAAVRAFAAGASSGAQTVRITRPPAKLARVIELGKAMVDLQAFVPGPVLRVCIDQTTLEALVDEKLVDRLRQYYTTFSPTVENPAEQAPLLTLLRGGLAPFMALADWVHDLHVFTPATRLRLVANIADKSRKRPVMLVLMSGLDWNAAFLQAANLESAVLNPANLALVVQGSKTLPGAAAMVNKVADDYGQIPKAGGKPRLGQVVIAGHGQATSVEQTTPGTGAHTDDDKTVGYDQAQINPTKPGDDSEKLVDTILTRMDPADARVVFAGCLVGSHDVPETPDLKDPTKAAAEINKALAANPNLRDIVKQRMAALGVKGTVEASNASTTFDAFNVDGSGKAKLGLSWDPDVGGTKADYVKTGAEPEGALRAALETWADPKFGPAWTTAEMRKHVAATAASNDWWVSLTRTAFEIALPAAGNVDPAVLANLAHRVESWLLAGWPASASAASLAASVTAAEAPKLYKVMLKSDHAAGGFPHLPIVVEQAWMQVDKAHEATFMTALGATPLKRVELTKLLAAGLIDPHLGALLTAADPAKPSKAQLLFALSIAVERGAGMPAAVKTLLTGAAGGKKTATFPAALKVPDLLNGANELDVLRSIGLAPGTTAPPKVGGGAVDDDANADLDGDNANETFVAVSPRIATITGPKRDIRDKPDAKAKVIGNLAPSKVVIAGIEVDKTVQVVGTSGTFTAIDVDGKIGFVDGAIP